MRTLNDIIPPSRRKEAGSFINPANPIGPDSRGPLNLSADKPPRFPYKTLGVVAIIVAASIGALF